MTEKWTSIAHHATNKHSWGGCKKFKRYDHHKLNKREMKSVPWIKPGSPSHKALQEVLFKRRFLNDLTKFVEFHDTGPLEVFHSLMLKYLPKRQHFPYQEMVTRTQLAALDHNFNLDRPQAVISLKRTRLAKQGTKLCSPKAERTG